MSVDIVDSLESVQVEHDERHHATSPGCDRKRLIQAVLQQNPVGQTGECIMMGGGREALLRGDVPGQVRDGDQHDLPGSQERGRHAYFSGERETCDGGQLAVEFDHLAIAKAADFNLHACAIRTGYMVQEAKAAPSWNAEEFAQRRGGMDRASLEQHGAGDEGA